MKRTKNRVSRRGAAAVETALVMPIFITVTFGIIEFGNAIMAKNMATVAAFEGARVAMIDGSTNSAVTTKVTNLLTGSIGQSASSATVSITIVPAAGNPDPANQVDAASTGDTITVKVQMSYSSIALMTGGFLTGKTMSVQCSMDHE